MRNKVLRLPDVLKAVCLSRSTLYLMVSEGRFPRPIKLGGRAVAWRESDVDAWLASREVA